jgi:type II secretory pathway component GspD/PulD (secretin)
MTMKTRLLSLPLTAFFVVTALAGEKGASRLLVPESTHRGENEAPTFSSFDRPRARDGSSVVPAGMLKFVDADVEMVLNIYQELSGRTVIRAVPLPHGKVTFQTQTPLSRVEALQALDTVLAESQIAMVLMGSKFVKAVPAAQAHAEAGPVIELPPDQLPDSSSYLVYIVKPKGIDATEALQMIVPFARLPNSVVAIKNPGVLILRDYSANVRRMLQVLERVEKAGTSR